MDYRPAEFVRFVEDSEVLRNVLDEAKSDTWTKSREHALLLLEDGRLALVRGGRDGIELMRESNGIYVEVEGRPMKILKLAWHIHPFVTGPSDHDHFVLELLDQASSVVYEVGGEAQGTRFGPKNKG